MRQPSLLLWQRLENLLQLGESADLLLGEDHVTVHGDHEVATASGDQFRLNAKPLLQISRQTGGFVFVASFGAVQDLYGHGSPPGFGRSPRPVNLQSTNGPILRPRWSAVKSA